MSVTPEGRVKARVKAILAKRNAWWCMPLGQAFGRAGIPDFIVCHRGRFLAIETKSARGKPTTMQELEMRCIRATGGAALVIRPDNLNELEEWLDGTDRKRDLLPGGGPDGGPPAP